MNIVRKRTAKRFLTAVFAATLFVAFTCAFVIGYCGNKKAAHAEEGEFVNGEFTAATCSALDGWAFRFEGADPFVKYYNPNRTVGLTEGREDANALSLVRKDDKSAGEFSFTFVQWGSSSIREQTEYTLSMWVKKTKVHFSVSVFTNAGSHEFIIDNADAYPDWHQISVDFTTAAGAATSDIAIYLRDAGELFIDDIELKEKATGTVVLSESFDGAAASATGWNVSGEAQFITHPEIDTARMVGFYGQGTLTSDAFDVSGYNGAIDVTYETSENADISLNLSVNGESISSANGKTFILPSEAQTAQLVFTGTTGALDNVSVAAHVHAYGVWSKTTEGYGVERTCECGEKQIIAVTGGATLTLEDEVKVNYKAALNDPANVGAEVSAKAYIYESASAQEAAAEYDMTYDGEKYYTAQNVKSYAIKEIGDSQWVEIEVTIEGIAVRLPRLEYSPKIYAENKLAEEGEFGSAKDLALTLLDYGAAAQAYFGYNEESLANAEVGEEVRAAAEVYRETAYGEYKAYEPQEFETEFPYATGMSLNLDGKVSINGYLTADDAESVEMAVFASEADAADKANATEVVTMELANGRYKGTTETTEFAAKELGDNVYIVFYVKKGEQVEASSVIRYGAEIYAYNMLNKAETGAETKALCEAMLNYAAASQIEFGYHTDDLANAGLIAEK